MFASKPWLQEGTFVQGLLGSGTNFSLTKKVSNFTAFVVLVVVHWRSYNYTPKHHTWEDHLRTCKQLGSPPPCIEPWNGRLEGEQPQLGDLLAKVISQLLNGMILQVAPARLDLPNKRKRSSSKHHYILLGPFSLEGINGENTWKYPKKHTSAVLDVRIWN